MGWSRAQILAESNAPNSASPDMLAETRRLHAAGRDFLFLPVTVYGHSVLLAPAPADAASHFLRRSLLT
jgi:hypothetical protein